MAIPSVGIDKVRVLFKRFRSVRAAINTSIADLKRVEEIGDKQEYYFVN